MRFDVDSFDLESAAERAKLDVDVPWDELRAARVHKSALAAFKAARDEPASEEDLTAEDEDRGRIETPETVEQDEPLVIPMQGSRRRPIALLVALVAVAAAIALFVRFGGGGDDFTSTLHYQDGSRSLMSAKAQVHVVKDTGSHVAVQQKAGRVRYDIMPRPERRFVVKVRGVTITVLGTVFDVDIREGEVDVTVERGRVRVETPGRKLELTTGEHATVKTDGANDGAESPAADAQLVDEHHEEADHRGAEVASGDEAPVEAPAPSAPSASSSAEAAPTAAEWLRRADTARGSGDNEGALRALHSLIAAYPTDARATLALFTIGQIERKRGNHAAAARAFEQCGAALKGDAIAEAAASWNAAGRGAQAHAAARRYLQTFPTGVHAESMRQLTGD